MVMTRLALSMSRATAGGVTPLGAEVGQVVFCRPTGTAQPVQA
jgi:hypothetical protein